ncbi:MAG TPA: methylated-DNA--[protein]-cysteine S-methyltransferase [Clostridia bacterium]|nr:methylated-DNA--[protein]-cysteine S-methyltransferase [Clostridia bacterium]
MRENRAMPTLYCTRMSSPVGTLVLAVAERGLVRLEFERSSVASSIAREQIVESAERTQPFVRELEEYFAGMRREFTFPLDLRGTDFQLKCWNALLTIPYGAVRSYAQIAQQVGCAKGFRAVGMANHDNPIAIVVPCHRVLASDGTLGGYAAGLDAKRWLLELEGVRVDFASLRLPFAAAASE